MRYLLRFNENKEVIQGELPDNTLIDIYLENTDLNYDIHHGTYTAIGDGYGDYAGPLRVHIDDLEFKKLRQCYWCLDVYIHLNEDLYNEQLNMIKKIASKIEDDGFMTAIKKSSLSVTVQLIVYPKSNI